MKTVIVINGRPRAGKDTAVAFMRAALTAKGIPNTAFSSIDPIKEMLAHHVDLSGKTLADRKLLSVVGDALQEHCQFRTRRSAVKIADFFDTVSKGVFFLHMREPALIDRLRGSCEARGWRFIAVLMTSIHSDAVTSNKSDDGVAHGNYDFSIRNDGTLDDLKRACADFVLDHIIKST